MAREDRGPRPLSDSLAQVARRVRRVDLVGLGAIEAAWPGVEAARRSEAVPVRLQGGELTVSVPSGAHAARARRDAARILAELAQCSAERPGSLRVVVAPR